MESRRHIAHHFFWGQCRWVGIEGSFWKKSPRTSFIVRRVLFFLNGTKYIIIIIIMTSYVYTHYNKKYIPLSVSIFSIIINFIIYIYLLLWNVTNYFMCYLKPNFFFVFFSFSLFLFHSDCRSSRKYTYRESFINIHTI